jgi:predicted DNA-binding transcriptional regulator YafY
MQSMGTQALKQKTTVRSKSQKEQKVVESQATIAAAIKRHAKVDFNSHDVSTPKI